MKQALIIDGSSAFREVTQAWNNAAPLQSVGTMSKTFKKRTTDTQVRCDIIDCLGTPK